MSVQFDPDGKTIVSGGASGTLKVWDAANPRPYNAAEWEKVEGGGEEDYDEEADMDYPYWKNTVTGELRQEESTAGVSPSNRSKSAHFERLVVGARDDGLAVGREGHGVHVAAVRALLLRLELQGSCSKRGDTQLWDRGRIGGARPPASADFERPVVGA